MRYALVLTAAALLAPSVPAADDPPITFQSHSIDRVFDELRAAADLVGGEKAVKAVNKGIKETFGEKGLDGLDITRPMVGYVLLDPKPANIAAVVAFPVTGEKEFLALCDRTNSRKHKELGKGLYELPPLDPQYKARLRFSDGYAYIAYGLNPEPALDAKALVPAAKLYDPAEKGIVSAKLHFDRIPAAVKLAIPTYVAEVKKALGVGDKDAEPWVKAMLPELEKMFARHVLLLGGAESAVVRLNVDVPTGDVVLEAVLTPKPDTPLAKELAGRKPTGNRFAGLLTPDTAAGFKTRLPFFNDELRTAAVKSLEEGQRLAANNAGPDAKDLVDELFKGLVRTVKTGEADLAASLRGPDKDGHFTFALAFAFEDTAALAKEFKKVVEKDPPPGDGIKWDADKAGDVAVHTYKFPAGNGWSNPSKVLGGDKCVAAWAFAPKGIYLVIGGDAVADLKAALAAKPGESPVLDVVLNPARMRKLVEKVEPRSAPDFERALGKEDKLVSAASLRVSGGKELTVRFALNLRVLPRAAAANELEAGAKPDDPVEKK